MGLGQFREAAAAFFAINDVIEQFVHGQVFLVLGVTMGLQWRQRSQVALSRALPWLAAWGIWEAIATWGNSFIPLQRQLLDPETIEMLRLLQLTAHLLCFTTLLGFGLKLIEHLLPQSAVYIGPAAVFVSGIALIFLLRAGISDGNYAIFNNRMEALLRHMVCLPSALLVAFGLRQQAIRLVGPFDTRNIIRSLRIAGIAFIAYAVAEGVLVPASDILIAPWLNTQNFQETFTLPVGIIRAAIGALILIFFFRALEVFRIEDNRAAQMLRQQQFLVADRERISRDLHDGTIQGIYAAGLMLESVKVALRDPDLSQANAKAQDQLDAVSTVLDKSIEDARGYIHDLRSGMAEEDLARGLMDIVTEFRIRTGMQTSWQANGAPVFTISPEQRQHVYQIAREALSNVTRHSKASQVDVQLTYGESFQLAICDNGHGHVPLRASLGRGLANMRERARLLHGDVTVNALPNKGTTVLLTLWPN